jgi:lactobin A/cerein 7B family class IIb bacteriocin
MPAHPAGLTELTEEEVRAVSGGTALVLVAAAAAAAVLASGCYINSCGSNNSLTIDHSGNSTGNNKNGLNVAGNTTSISSTPPAASNPDGGAPDASVSK